MKANVTMLNQPLTGEEGTLMSVSFGSVTVKAPRPPEHIRLSNIAAGQAALKRAKSALIKAGIELPRKKDVPLYFGCEDQPGVMIQELNGKRTLGKFVNGRFRPLKSAG